MSEYGFDNARLAPNLLNVSEEDAKKKAQIMREFLEIKFPAPASISSHRTDFHQSKKKDKSKGFSNSPLIARGWAGFPIWESRWIYPTLSLSHLCGFIPRAAVPIEEMEYNIYNPKLWEVSYQFIKERMESLLKNCMECELISICAGGCILSGIDIENRLNKAACVYQKEMWKMYVKKAYEDRNK